jgi:elongation factor P hydroxylase
LSQARFNSAAKLVRSAAISVPLGEDGPMSINAENIIPSDRYRGPGTYTEALLEQSHRKEAGSRSAEFVTYGWSAAENVICSKTTRGILESLINPNTMEVIHYWASQRDRQRRLVKVS